jgi:uncharacterized protein (TIGR03437 family)
VPLPTSLAGLSVTINGLAAPLFFASANQINLQVPSGVTAGTPTSRFSEAALLRQSPPAQLP